MNLPDLVAVLFPVDASPYLRASWRQQVANEAECADDLMRLHLAWLERRRTP